MTETLGLDDMFRELQSMPLIGKIAIAFAVYEDLNIDDVIYIRWPQLKNIELGWKAKKVIDSLPIHIKTDFVFWENGSDLSPKPIIRLKDSFLENSSYEWWEFKEKFRDSLPIDFTMDHHILNFTNILNSEEP